MRSLSFSPFTTGVNTTGAPHVSHTVRILFIKGGTASSVSSGIREKFSKYDRFVPPSAGHRVIPAATGENGII